MIIARFWKKKKITNVPAVLNWVRENLANTVIDMVKLTNYKMEKDDSMVGRCTESWILHHIETVILTIMFIQVHCSLYLKKDEMIHFVIILDEAF